MKCSRVLAATRKNRPIALSNLTEPKSYRFGRFIVDRRSACLRCDGAVLALRPKTFDVLVYLVQHPGRLVPKAELIDSVWQNVNVTENSLVQCIREIRQALGDDSQTKVETISKRGYLFASPWSRSAARNWTSTPPARPALHPARIGPCRCPIAPPSRSCRSTI